MAAGGARGSGAVSARIRALLGSLTRAETAVAEVVLDRHNDVVGLSVEALAEQAGVSTATVLRLSQALGFSGFKELKIALAMERGGAQLGPLQEEISPDDPPIQIARKVMQAEIVALTEVSELLDEAELEAAVAALAGARAIEIYGMGSSAPVVMDAYYRFLRLGLRVSTPPDSHMQAVNAALLGPGDVALVISHTGQTKDVVHTARQAREVGATVITLTSYYRTPLHRYGHVHLVAATSETNANVEAMASRTAHLAIVDTLYVALAMRDPRGTGEALAKTQVAIDEQRK